MIPTLQMGQMGLGRLLLPPVTAYDSGDRTALITVTASFVPDAGTLSNLVDDDLTANANGGIDMPGVGATSSDGAWINFAFTAKWYFTKARIRFNAGANMGAWEWGVGNNGIYIPVGSNTWNSDDLETTLSAMDPEGYTDIQWRKVGTGGVFTNSWCVEFNFERGPGAV